MAHFLSRYDLYDFAVKGIKAFVNNAEVTTETTVPAGAVLKLIAYNGGVFTRVYFLDHVELVELKFSLTGTKKEALAYVPSWNGALHYTGTFNRSLVHRPLLLCLTRYRYLSLLNLRY